MILDEYVIDKNYRNHILGICMGHSVKNKYRFKNVWNTRTMKILVLKTLVHRKENLLHYFRKASCCSEISMGFEIIESWV